jgi:hypothetical protein
MTIDSPRTSTPTPELDQLSFPTVEDEIDEDEAASSFKEFTDWMRFLAQHRGQRGRLYDLLGEARESLKGLMGLEEAPSHPATYASAAAKATLSPGSRPAQTAQRQSKAQPRLRHIQNAVNRFERLSEELPGVPRKAVLGIVARSNLQQVSPPLPTTPQTRKKPACLVKGIRANTVAVRLPEGATTPTSIPALIQSANKRLIDEKLAGRIKELLLGVRRHVTIVFDRVVEDSVSKTALYEVLKGFKTSEVDSTILTRTTHSVLKFNAVPTITHDGQKVTAAVAAACLQRHPAWKDAKPLGPPEFVFLKDHPTATHATLRIKVQDTQKATVAKKLLETTVTFVGVARRCLPWSVSQTARQCSSCLKWGHSAYVCRAREPHCDQCAGNHLTAYHRHHASTCKDASCGHYHIRCSNCSQQHHASSTACPFFQARSSPGKLQELQKQRLDRQRRNQGRA